MEINLPAELWIIILPYAIDSFETLQYLFMLNKQVYHIINYLIDKGLISIDIYPTSKQLLFKGDFPQNELIVCLLKRGFTFCHTLKNRYLHGLCKKWSLDGTETEFMIFRLGKLVHHTVKKEKKHKIDLSPSENARRLYVYKKVDFYPTFKIIRYAETGKTLKIITSTSIKTTDIDGILIYTNVITSPQSYQKCLEKEMDDYKDLKKWIEKPLPKK